MSAVASRGIYLEYCHRAFLTSHIRSIRNGVLSILNIYKKCIDCNNNGHILYNCTNNFYVHVLRKKKTIHSDVDGKCIENGKHAPTYVKPSRYPLIKHLMRIYLTNGRGCRLGIEE